MAEEALKDLKDYLAMDSNIPMKDKKYVFDFYNKFQYLSQLNKALINQTHEKMFLGYGNYNSKIMIVVLADKFLGPVINIIKPMMDKMNISLWNTYITVLNKGNSTTDYLPTIINEINAVCPRMLYVIDIYDVIPKAIEAYKENAAFKRLNDVSVRFINLNDICFLDDPKNKTKSEVEWLKKRNSVWMLLRGMMSFKDKEILE